MNGIGKLDWANVKSALVYGLLWGILAMAIDVVQAGDIFKLDLKELLNIGIIAFLAVFISLLKNLLTDNSGKFLGVTEVIPDKE